MRLRASLLAALLAGFFFSHVFAGDDALDRAYLGKRKQVDEQVAGGFLIYAKAFELHKSGARAKVLASHVLVIGSALQAKDAKKLIDKIGEKPTKEQDAETEGQVEDALPKYKKAYDELIAFCEKKKLSAEMEDAKSRLERCLGCSASAGKSGSGAVVTTFDGMTDDDKKCLERVNYYRKRAGLSPVSIDAGLCEGCRLHCHYLVVNNGKPQLEGLKAHDEDLSLPSSSEAGRKAGLASDLAFGTGAAEAVDAWMESLYHRIPILHPDLERVGCAAEKGITALDLSAKKQPLCGGQVSYPVDGAKDERRFFGRETPDPIPAGAGNCGFPITVTGFGEKHYGSFEGTLEMKVEPEPPKEGEGATGASEPKKPEWKSVPVYCSAPDKPARADRPDNGENSICMIPQAVLNQKTTYRATLVYRTDSGETKRVITFTTGE